MVQPAGATPTVTLRDVALRDGLQGLAPVLPTAHKVAWLHAMHAAGVRAFEVGSFVPAQRMPQLADTAQLVAEAKALPGSVVTVLVPNLRGAEAALASGADAMLMPLSASRAHSLANLRRTPEEALAELARIRAARDASGTRCRLEVGVSTAFGCTLQGEVAPHDVLRLLQAALDAGADAVGLSDTVGFADPFQVTALTEAGRRAVGERLETAHFHDTRGLGLANAYAAWQCGIRHFDGSHGGLGGCPHAPGASGNVATEDLAFMFARGGIASGLDVEALIALRSRVAGWLPGIALHGHVWRAGVPRVAAVHDA